MALDMLPKAVARHLRGVGLKDRTFSESAATYFCPVGDGLYLRVNSAGKERENALMTEYFYKKGLGPQVVEYVTQGERDYLLTTALPGVNGVTPELLAQPKRFIGALGEAFRGLHEIKDEDIPVRGFTNRFCKETEQFIREEARRRAWPEDYARRYGMTAEEALTLLPSVASWEEDDSLIHGDACLPNVMFQNFAFTGFVDLGAACLGDRHYDLGATLWSLEYNLKTGAYNDLFLDAYGRDHISGERLALYSLSWW